MSLLLGLSSADSHLSSLSRSILPILSQIAFEIAENRASYPASGLAPAPSKRGHKDAGL